jgi:transcriptional regulator with XRE-family HTH domain
MTDHDELNQRIGAAIRAARGRRGITQDELAPELGVDRATLARYERGQRGMSAAMLVHLCHLFGESLDALLAGVVPRPSLGDGAPLDDTIHRIVVRLQHRPDLAATVEDLLDTMTAPDVQTAP